MKKLMIKKNKYFVLCLLILFAAGCSTSYDMIIKGGTIYDGIGSAPVVADIGIVNGNIKNIG